MAVSSVDLALRNLWEGIELYLQDEDAKALEVDHRPMAGSRDVLIAMLLRSIASQTILASVEGNS